MAEIYPNLVAYESDGTPIVVQYQYLATMLLNEMEKHYHRAQAEAEVIREEGRRRRDCLAWRALSGPRYRLLRKTHSGASLQFTFVREGSDSAFAACGGIGLTKAV